MTDPSTPHERTALIIGISNGVVQQTVLELARQGFFVIYVDGNQELCELVKQKLLDQGLSGWGIHCDYWDINEITKLFRQLKKSHGKLDLVVTNLNLECKSLENLLDAEIVSRTVNRTFTLCAESWLQMQVKGGFILNIAPVKAKAASKPKSVYANAGVAVSHLSEKFANDCSPYQIQCSSERVMKKDEKYAKEKASQLVSSMSEYLETKKTSKHVMV